ncbi:MAG: hypothetical protein Q9M31_00590 [Mariprofundus sp.]|nr:hypothetical protein [Mariprofundus sp.]
MAKDVIRGRLGVRARILALMSYLGVLCIVPLLMNRDDHYVNFHARQGLILWVWSVLAFLALHLPFLGKWFSSMSLMMVLVFSAIGIVSVLLRKAWRIPFIYSLSTKI